MVKYRKLKRDGEKALVAFFGVMTTSIVLEEVVVYRSINIVAAKAIVSTTAQINLQDFKAFDIVDVAADTFLIPLV